MNPSSLPLDELETVYDELAQAIDQAAALGRAELFLTKLALLNAQALGSATHFRAQLEAALRDLR